MRRTIGRFSLDSPIQNVSFESQRQYRGGLPCVTAEQARKALRCETLAPADNERVITHQLVAQRSPAHLCPSASNRINRAYESHPARPNRLFARHVSALAFFVTGVTPDSFVAQNLQIDMANSQLR